MGPRRTASSRVTSRSVSSANPILFYLFVANRWVVLTAGFTGSAGNPAEGFSLPQKGQAIDYVHKSDG